MTRKKYFLNKDLSYKEYVLWRKLARDFNTPTQINKNSIFTQIRGEEHNTIQMKIDSHIPDVTGLLTILLLSDITLKLNLLSSSQKNLLNDGTLIVFCFCINRLSCSFLSKINSRKQENIFKI